MKTPFYSLLVAVAGMSLVDASFAQPLPTYYDQTTIAKLSPLAPVGSFLQVTAASESGTNFIYFRRDNGGLTIQTYYWSPTTGNVLVQPLPGYGDIVLWDVNSNGVAVGYCRTSEDEMADNYLQEPVIWTPQTGAISMRNPGTNADRARHYRMYGVNEIGDTVGMRHSPTADIGSEAILRKADGTVIVIPGMFRALKINDSGEVLGENITGVDAADFATFGASVWREGDVESTVVGPVRGALPISIITNAGDIVIPFEVFNGLNQTGNHKIAIVRASNRSTYEVFESVRQNNLFLRLQVSDNQQLLVSETIRGTWTTTRHKYYNWITGFYTEFVPEYSFYNALLFKNGDVVFENNRNYFTESTTKKWDFMLWREGVGQRAVRGMLDALPYPSNISYRKHSPARILQGGKLVVESQDFLTTTGPNGVSEISLLTPRFTPDPYVPYVPPSPPVTTSPAPPNFTPQPEPTPVPGMSDAEFQTRQAEIQSQIRAASRMKNPRARQARIRTLQAQLTQLNAEYSGGSAQWQESPSSSDAARRAEIQSQIRAASKIKNPKARQSKIRALRAQLAQL